MRLATLIERYEGALQQQYAARLLPEQRRALTAIRACRTTAAGEVLWHCEDCAHSMLSPRSCGHRSCPQCQNHEARQWLDRQRRKLLPVEYFMVTFTLPAQLGALAWRVVFRILCHFFTISKKEMTHDQTYLRYGCRRQGAA